MPYEWEEWALHALSGIEAYEVRQVLDAARRWPRPGTHHATGLQVITVWGRTRTGRGLIIALYHSDGFTWKIAGAREMSDSELAEFARWEETR